MVHYFFSKSDFRKKSPAFWFFALEVARNAWFLCRKVQKDKLVKSTSAIRFFIHSKQSENSDCTHNSSRTWAATAESQSLRSSLTLGIEVIVMGMVSNYFIEWMRLCLSYMRKRRLVYRTWNANLVSWQREWRSRELTGSAKSARGSE
jgi:hypothetical protein